MPVIGWSAYDYEVDIERMENVELMEKNIVFSRAQVHRVVSNGKIIR